MKKKYMFSLLVAVLSCSLSIGQTWNQLGKGVNGIVYALCTFDSVLYAGGTFDSAGGQPAKYVAQWNGTSWSAIGNGLSSDVYALIMWNGHLYAGGKSVEEWNGTTWSVLPGIIGSSTTVYALVVMGSNLYAYTGSDVDEWNGTSWSNTGGTISSNVYAQPYCNHMVTDGTNLFIGSNYNISGSYGYSVDEWSGTSWTSIDNYTSEYCCALAFYNSSTVAAFWPSGYGQWKSGTWSTAYGTNGLCYAMLTYGGNLYAAGSSCAGDGGSLVDEWNGTAWVATGAMKQITGNTVYALASYEGNIYAGGTFKIVNSDTVNNITGFFNVPTSVNNIETKNSSLVYPNPNHGIFNLLANNTLTRSEIRIYNITGQEIFICTLKEGNNNINLNTQPAGIYLYRIVSGDGVSQGSGKFVIE
ncbi:MAG: T9SS type A sorting domain-containing protein [Bacteroidia bacterium]